MSDNQTPDDDGISKERRILIAMRKTLAQIVREVAPEPGLRHPLSKTTIEDVRTCFGLISARERELAERDGLSMNERPRFIDEPQSSKVVSIDSIRKVTPQKSDI